jgi:aspartyl-tRNA(Asn)/glutamyl-tRNA(Gln) amidotransferase subunit A
MARPDIGKIGGTNMKFFTEIDKTGNIAVDDMILVKDIPATAGSKMLENFVPLFDAEVVSRIKNAGLKLAGKTAVGELGLSAFNGNKNDIPCDISLNVDLNGTPRRMAAVCDKIFIKPTYGTVSRYGVIACVSSAETVGVTAETADKCAEILSIISGYDEKDGTSLPTEKYVYDTNKNVADMKIAVLSDITNKASDEVKTQIEKTVSALQAKGAEVQNINFELSETAATAYTILMCAETCNNISRFDGVKYGHRTADYKNIDELYTNSRTEGFTLLTKTVILYGSDVLSKDKYDVCYDKSLRIRRLISEKLDGIFENYDAVLLPAGSSFEIGETEGTFENMVKEIEYSSIASISGNPAVIANRVQFVAKKFDENTLLSIAKSL